MAPAWDLQNLALGLRSPGALPESERRSTRTASWVFNFLRDYVFILKDVVSCFLT